MGQIVKKSTTVLLAFILAVSLMLPYGALNPQMAWADDTTSDANAEDIQLVIKAGAATPTDESNTTFKFPSLTVESNSNRPIKSITVQFTSPITTDSITLPTQGKFVQYQPVKAGNVSINVNDGATASEWQQYLRDNLQITLSNVNTTASIRMIASFDPVNATIDYNSLNGHYYKTVKGSSITWQNAYAAAQNSKYMGMQGYLVTVTSQEENNYVFSMIGEDCWTGATCLDEYTGANSEEHNCAIKNIYKDFYIKQGINIPESTMPGNAYYFWVDGPEKGQLISRGLTTNRVAAPDPTSDPDNPSPMFTYWNDGEPNNSSGEQCMHFLKASGKWNDYVYNNASVTAYVIEYGGMESDEELEESNTGSSDADVDVYVKVDINIDPTAKTITTEADDIYVGQPLAIKENVNGEYIQDENTGEYQVKTIVGRDADDNSRYLYENTTPTRTYSKLKDGGKPSRKDDWIELQAGELPTHVGTYKVVSSATFLQQYKDSDGQDHPTQLYKPGSATFKIKKKSLDLTNPATPVTPSEPGVEDPNNPDATKDTVIKDVDPSNPDQTQEVSVSGRNYTKVYDGTKQFPGPGTINISDLVEPGAQAYLTYESAEYKTSDAGDSVDLVLHGVQVKGVDAADYSVAGITTGEDGKTSLTVKGIITPRPIVITTSFTNEESGALVTGWTTGVKTDPIAYTNNAQEYNADVVDQNGGVIPNYMLCPTEQTGEGEAAPKPNTIKDVLGDVTYAVMTHGGLVLDTQDPQAGTYSLIPHFSKVATTGTSKGYLTENGNYYVNFENGPLVVKNRGITTIGGTDEDGDGEPDPIVITTPVKPDPTDPNNPDNPNDPSNPSNPSNPGGSTNPGDPSDPTNPDKPSGGVDVEKIIEDVLDDPVDPNDPDGPKKGDKVPSGSDPVITITKGGEVIDEIDPSEPGEYNIHVVYPADPSDPDAEDVVLDIVYIIEPEEPVVDPAVNYVTVSTKLKGATQGATITPSQTLAKGANATVAWTPGENAYIAMIEVDGKSIDVNTKDFTFADIQANHEVVVTLAEIPVIPATTTKGFYTITVNKYGATQGLTVSDSAVATKGDTHVVEWSVQPGTVVKSVTIDGKALSAAQVATNRYTFADIAANHVVDIVAESATGETLLKPDNLQVSTQIVGGPGTITGGSTVAKGDSYDVSWQPVIKTTDDKTSPDYAVYEVESVKVNGKAAAGPNDRDLSLDNITEDQNVVVTLKPVIYNVNIKTYGNGTASASKSMYKGNDYADIKAQAGSGSYISYIEIDGKEVYRATAAPATDAGGASGQNAEGQSEQLSAVGLLAASVQAVIVGEPLDLSKEQGTDSAASASGKPAGNTGNTSAPAPADKPVVAPDNNVVDNVTGNEAGNAAGNAADNNAADNSQTEGQVEDASADESAATEVAPEVQSAETGAAAQGEAQTQAQAYLSSAQDANIMVDALNALGHVASALTYVDNPTFEPEAIEALQVSDNKTFMTSGVTNIEKNHKYVIYFTENGKTPITPDTLKDDKGNPPSTIETEITGGPGEVTIIGDTILPKDPDPTGPSNPDTPTPAESPKVTWEVPDDSVVTEIIITTPEGIKIGDPIKPEPGQEQKGSATIPDNILEYIKNNPGDYKIEVKTEKRVSEDTTKPPQRTLSNPADENVQTYEISTKLTGGPGTITATTEIVEGDSHTVTWEVGEQDGVKYRVAKVIIDGVEHPELVNATSYTFEDLAANHIIEVVVEPVPDEPADPTPSADSDKPGKANPDDQAKKDSSAKTGDYMGMLIGGVAVVAVLAAIALVIARRKMQRKKENI